MVQVAAESFRGESGRLVQPGMSKFDVINRTGGPKMIDQDVLNPNAQSWFYIKGNRSYQLQFNGSTLQTIRPGEYVH